MDDEREAAVGELLKSYGRRGEIEDLRGRVELIEEWVKEILMEIPTRRLIRMLKNKGHTVIDNTSDDRD